MEGHQCNFRALGGKDFTEASGAWSMISPLWAASGLEADADLCVGSH